MKFRKMIAQEVEVTHLLADMEVRYWEDAVVNGEQDSETAPRIPFAEGDTWRLLIDLSTGKISNWPQGTTASVHYKVCDAGVYRILSAAGEEVAELAGYVPAMLSPERDGFGDYVIMDIDESGLIAGWKADLSYFEQGETA